MNTFKTSSGFQDFPLLDSWKSTVNEKNFQLQPSKLLTSKSGFFIRKQIFHFFTIIQKQGLLIQTVDSLDLTQNRILWIHGLKHFLSTDTKGVNTSAAQLYCSSLRPFFNPRHGLIDRFYPCCRSGKIARQTGPALFQFTMTKLLHNVAGESCKKLLPMHILSHDLSSFGPSQALSLQRSPISKRKWETQPRLVMTLAYAHPYIQSGKKVLSRLYRGGGGEFKTCSLRLSQRNVSQFTQRQPREFYQF